MTVVNGTVKFFARKGFGFIAPDEGEDIYVHCTGIKNWLREGDEVTYEVTIDERTEKPMAINVEGGSGTPYLPKAQRPAGERRSRRKTSKTDTDKKEKETDGGEKKEGGEKEKKKRIRNRKPKTTKSEGDSEGNKNNSEQAKEGEKKERKPLTEAQLAKLQEKREKKKEKYLAKKAEKKAAAGEESVSKAIAGDAKVAGSLGA